MGSRASDGLFDHERGLSYQDRTEGAGRHTHDDEEIVEGDVPPYDPTLLWAGEIKACKMRLIDCMMDGKFYAVYPTGSDPKVGKVVIDFSGEWSCHEVYWSAIQRIQKSEGREVLHL